jgi:hypothetical protein
LLHTHVCSAFNSILLVMFGSVTPSLEVCLMFWFLVACLCDDVSYVAGEFPYIVLGLRMER